MDPISLGLLVGAVVVPAVVSLIGNALASGDKDKARQLYEKAASQYGDAIVPQLQKVVAEKFGRSALEQVAPRGDIAQDQDLARNKMAEIANTSGMTAEDAAAAEGIRQQAMSQERAQRLSVLQGMQRRGMANSGASIAAQMQAQQGAADRNSLQDINVMAQSMANRRQAIMGLGQLSGQQQQQYLDLASQKAQAQDNIRRFDIENIYKAAQMNNQAAKDQFGMQMQKAQGQQQAAAGLAGYYKGSADDTRAMWGGIGQAAGAGLGAGANMANENALAGQKAAQQLAAQKARFSTNVSRAGDYGQPLIDEDGNPYA